MTRFRSTLLLPALVTAALAPGWAMSYSDVEYAKVNGQPLLLDAYVPDAPGPHPAAIIVHGGAWVTGDKGRSVRPLFEPLAGAGYAWFSINYRLARGMNLDSLISIETLSALVGAGDDVRAAVAYIRAHAGEYNIDPDRIALIGESAGAQLASMAALRPQQGGEVGAVVAFYSPSDLEDLVKTSDRIPDALRDAVRGTVLESMLLGGLRQISPRHAIHPGAPPFLLIHGTADRLVPYRQSVEMCEALDDAGDSCELIRVDGGGHGVRGWERSREQTAYKARMTDWLDEHLR